MPYLQIDVSRSFPVDTKRNFATKVAEAYSSLMQMDIARVSVAIRELGDGGLWRFSKEEPYQGALLMCDIRRGRSADQRSALAEALIDICMQELRLGLDEVNVEFTQHAGDEMYHPLLGGLSEDWSGTEAAG